MNKYVCVRYVALRYANFRNRIIFILVGLNRSLCMRHDTMVKVL